MPSHRPDIEIVENGKTVDTSAIDDYDSFMQFLMLASANRQLVKIREYFDDRKPSGYIQPQTFAVTQARQRVILPWKAQSASFINDGPNLVYVWINSIERPPHTVNPNEVFNINFEIHKLEEFWLQCDPGNTAAVRVVPQD